MADDRAEPMRKFLSGPVLTDVPQRLLLSSYRSCERHSASRCPMAYR